MPSQHHLQEEVVSHDLTDYMMTTAGEGWL